MKCSEADKYLEAFGDDELNKMRDTGALEHIQSCPTCKVRVEHVRRLKGHLAQHFASGGRAQELKERVRGALDTPGNETLERMNRLQRWVVPLGVAAAIAFVWFASPLLKQNPERKPVAIEAQWISSLVKTHEGCLRLGPKHHRASFSRDPQILGKQLEDVLGFRIWAPDLSQVGFRLHSADTCGLASVPGGHIVYERSGDKRLISIFSLRDLEFPPVVAPVQGANREYFVSRRHGGTTLIAWNQGDRTCVICGDLRTPELIRVANLVD